MSVAPPKQTKVFCFFFSKKKLFLKRTFARLNAAALALAFLATPAAAQPMPVPPPAAQTPAAKPVPITITGAWARATAPGQTEGAAYVTLSSPGGDRLIGVDTAAAGMAMLHQSLKKNGVAEMRDLDALGLPAGKTVKLSPGGVHIMLMDLKNGLKPGDTLKLSLSFAHAGRRDIDVPVRPIGADGP